MNPTPRTIMKNELLGALPPPWPEDVLPAIRQRVAASQQKLVVLDDDPTGTQTVYDVPVLTEWSVENLRAELRKPGAGFYILTNSRSLPLEEARVLNRQIASNLLEAAGLDRPRSGPLPFTVVSRSDSTLRGHFPGETDALAEVLGTFDGVWVIPFFEAGGRFTVNDVHYVAEGDKLVPAAETPFAKDAAFGYQHSNLRAWISEKSQGRVQPEEVVTISLETLRRGGPERVRRQLMSMPRGAYGVVNAACQRDLEVFVLGLLEAESHGKRYLFRTAASFVAARLGLSTRPLLTERDLGLPSEGAGLTVVGSYVPRTTSQLEHLLDEPELVAVELHVPSLLDPDRREKELDRALAEVGQALTSGRDTVVFTSRDVITGPDATSSLRIGRQVSDTLVALVERLPVRPRYLIGKGGITSSDLATRALKVKRGWVLGQIAPGVPVWRLGPETRFPGLTYVVFPGNVGTPETLRDVVRRLRRPSERDGTCQAEGA